MRMVLINITYIDINTCSGKEILVRSANKFARRLILDYICTINTIKMIFRTEQLPSFAIKASKIAASRPGDTVTSLTISEAEICVKGWMWEAAAELQDPPEKAPLYLDRLEAIEALRLSALTFDRLVKSGIIKKGYLGKKLVFTQESLAAAILDEKTEYYKK